MLIHCMMLLLFVCVFTRSDGTIASTIYMKQSEFSHKIATNILSNCIEGTPSLVRCVWSCNLNQDCLSVFYVEFNKTCQLNFQKITQTDLVNSVGTQFYLKVGEGTATNQSFIEKLSFHCSPGKTKTEAEAECAGNGYRLAVTDTAEKVRMLRDKIIIDPNLDENVDYYLGATKNSTIQPFKWSNGVIIPYPNDSFWRDYEPNNEASEFCITIAPGYLNGLLNDDTCGKSLCYVCEAQ